MFPVHVRVKSSTMSCDLRSPQTDPVRIQLADDSFLVTLPINPRDPPTFSHHEVLVRTAPPGRTNSTYGGEFFYGDVAVTLSNTDLPASIHWCFHGDNYSFSLQK